MKFFTLKGTTWHATTRLRGTSNEPSGNQTRNQELITKTVYKLSDTSCHVSLKMSALQRLGLASTEGTSGKTTRPFVENEIGPWHLERFFKRTKLCLTWTKRYRKDFVHFVVYIRQLKMYYSFIYLQCCSLNSSNRVIQIK